MSVRGRVSLYGPRGARHEVQQARGRARIGRADTSARAVIRASHASGTSLHRSGTELELGPPAAYGWLSANANRFHFTPALELRTLAVRAPLTHNDPARRQEVSGVRADQTVTVTTTRMTTTAVATMELGARLGRRVDEAVMRRRRVTGRALTSVASFRGRVGTPARADLHDAQPSVPGRCWPRAWKA